MRPMRPSNAPNVGGYHAIVLAAGAGSRFGGGKMLASWEGRPLVRAATGIALSAPVDTVTVVVGGDADRIAAALSDVADLRLRVVHAADWRTGLSASLRAGIAALPADARGALVFLGDMPRVPPTSGAALLAALDAGAPAATVSVEGKPAHPVALSARLFSGVAALTGDRGARVLLAGIDGVVDLPSEDAGATFDVDSAADLSG